VRAKDGEDLRGGAHRHRQDYGFAAAGKGGRIGGSDAFGNRLLGVPGPDRDTGTFQEFGQGAAESPEADDGHAADDAITHR
jgi:hypothetical protein